MLVLLDLSHDKHHLPFSLSFSSSLYIFISGCGASRTSADSGYFGVLVIWASILTRYPLISHFIDYDSILALVFMYCISYFISFTVFILCVADPSWSLTSEFLLWLPCYYFRLVSCMLPFNTCISLWQPCYHLTIWHATIWQDLLIMSWLTRLSSISYHV